jgi:cytochrome c oxidase subunit II
MKIDFYEKVFLGLTAVMLLAFAVFLVYAVQAHGITVAGPAGRVDPEKLAETPPWDEPGVVEQAPGKYLATVVARTWFFTPAVITVPVGAEVTFQIASADIIHGFLIRGTDVNIMVIPGEVSLVTHTFDEAGEYQIACHEYCGTGHQTMHAKVVVEEQSGRLERDGTAPVAVSGSGTGRGHRLSAISDPSGRLGAWDGSRVARTGGDS